MAEMKWNSRSQEVFNNAIGHLRQFHRSIAEKLVKDSAERIACTRGVETVEEQDLIQAFFKEVPPAFKDMIKRLFRHLNVEYKNYVRE
jgi:hypothetical protein